MNELNQDCFVIMPFSECEGYSQGHFKNVYDNIIKPSAINAGFKPIRGDEVKQANLIHVDIIDKLYNSSIAICDLSTHNPNVMFELGLRQALDKPVVLIQEMGTPKIFDVSIFRYIEYNKDCLCENLDNIVSQISDALIETYENTDNFDNKTSILRLLPSYKPQYSEIWNNIRTLNEAHKKDYITTKDYKNRLIEQSSLLTNELLKGNINKDIIKLLDFIKNTLLTSN